MVATAGGQSARAGRMVQCTGAGSDTASPSMPTGISGASAVTSICLAVSYLPGLAHFTLGWAMRDRAARHEHGRSDNAEPALAWRLGNAPQRSMGEGRLS